MGKSLAEYAAAHPMEAPAGERQQMQAQAKAIVDRREQAERVERLKESIAHQLKKGNAPQLILYTAIECIGAATGDAVWEQEATATMDAIWADTLQTTIAGTEGIIAAERMLTRYKAYQTKIVHQLERLHNTAVKTASELQAALDAASVPDYEPFPPEE